MITISLRTMPGGCTWPLSYAPCSATQTCWPSLAKGLGETPLRWELCPLLGCDSSFSPADDLALSCLEQPPWFHTRVWSHGPGSLRDSFLLDCKLRRARISASLKAGSALQTESRAHLWELCSYLFLLTGDECLLFFFS